MADTSTILALPLILPAQAQKHVTHNDALRLLDLVVQLSVKDRTLAVPPAAPLQGDRYIVPAAATGAWAGQTGKIALYENAVWQFFTPLPGWQAYIEDEATVAVFGGVGWAAQADKPLSVPQLGVSATPDATNRLSVNAPATLLNHAGAGHQLKLNKALASDTASLNFQTGFSGRAEMGTTGSDDFAIKVSPDGSSYFTALTVARATGQVTLPQLVKLGGQASDPASPSNGQLWLNSTSGQIKMRSAGVTQPVGVSDGAKGDVTVSGGGTVWVLDAAVKYGLQLAVNQQAFFN